MIKQVSILICGAGPSGLSLSLALSRLGIKHTIVEQHQAPSAHPKAKALNVRTMELFDSGKLKIMYVAMNYPWINIDIFGLTVYKVML